jgi:hypothetical protein
MATTQRLLQLDDLRDGRLLTKQKNVKTSIGKLLIDGSNLTEYDRDASGVLCLRALPPSIPHPLEKTVNQSIHEKIRLCAVY